MKRICDWLCRHIVPNRAPDFIVGEVPDPYLLRWWLIPRNRFFNIYLHWIRRSDNDRAKHDHPWPSLSLMIHGDLLEHYDEPYRDEREHWRVRGWSYRPKLRRIVAGQWIYRPAHFTHRLEVPKTPYHPGAWTIFFTGPKIREWGFACPVVGWRHWKEFGDPDNGNGKGCDP